MNVSFDHVEIIKIAERIVLEDQEPDDFNGQRTIVSVDYYELSRPVRVIRKSLQDQRSKYPTNKWEDEPKKQRKTQDKKKKKKSGHKDKMHHNYQHQSRDSLSPTRESPSLVPGRLSPKRISRPNGTTTYSPPVRYRTKEFCPDILQLGTDIMM
jgi:hypothetical protein